MTLQFLRLAGQGRFFKKEKQFRYFLATCVYQNSGLYRFFFSDETVRHMVKDTVISTSMQIRQGDLTNKQKYFLNSSSINPPILHSKEVGSNLLNLLADHRREVSKVSIAT